jgi:hypothetical protein
MRTFRGAALILALSLLIVSAVPAAGQAAVRVFVNGEQVMFDQPPVVVGSRVLVPLRGIFEKMGATVVWVPEGRTVRAQSATTSVELRIGSTTALVNGASVTLDVPAQIVGGRTLVPLRFISESLGASVNYDAGTRTVVITSAGAGPPPPGPPQPPAPPGPPGPARITLTIVRPFPGELVSNPLRARGTTAANARVTIDVMFQGERVGRKAVTADARGEFDTNVRYEVRQRNETYRVIITASRQDLGSTSQTIRVTVR